MNRVSKPPRHCMTVHRDPHEGRSMKRALSPCGRLASVLIAGVLGLTACAHYQARPIEPAASASAFEARSLHDAGLQTYLRQHVPGTQAPARWDLRTLTWVAFYYQPELDVARAQWDGAKAAAITAGARPNPTLDITNQYDVDAPSGVSPWTVGPALLVPIETAGKRDARVRQAQHAAESARLNVAEVAWQIRQRVRSALLGIYPTVPLVRQEQAKQAELVALIERRLKAGEASQPDLTQARIALDRLTLDTQEAQRRLTESRSKLATALGLPTQALGDARLSLESFEQLPPPGQLPSKEMRRQALLNRPDVRAALADYEASQAALQGEIAKQYPDITLGPGFQWDAGEAKWSLGLSLTLPLFNHNQGPIAEARARRQEAAARFMTVQAKAIGEIEQSLADYREMTSKLAVADRLLTAQRKAAASAEAQFRAGETDRVDLVGAQVELAAAELARADTLIQAQQSLGALEDALRHPLDAPLDLESTESVPSKQGAQP